MASKLSQVFSVSRKTPELIFPARPTPREFKLLSDIDDQESLRFQALNIFFYKNNPSPSMIGKDPVGFIREGLSKALVFYYPLAGRLQEGDNRKLMVDCNAEGILFIEADANLTLEQLGDAIKPPCPYVDELIYDVPGSDGILGCPLLLIQVTRLACGGFILGLRFNHTIWDAVGLVQFLKTVEEMGRGEQTPSLLPVWQRELLSARNPPKVTSVHNEYDETNNDPDDFTSTNPNDMAHKSFYFGSKEIRSLRQQLPLHLRNCTAFDLLTAFIWRCRTIALKLDPEENVRLTCVVSVRVNHYNMHLPTGYYGNAIVYQPICSKAEAICTRPLGYAVELLKAAKAKLDEEYIRSAIDFIAITGRRAKYPTRANYIVSDLRRSGFAAIDLGWGKPVFGGTIGSITPIVSFLNEYKKEDGETGILIPVRLPPSNMERFEEEMKRMIQGSRTEDLQKDKEIQTFSRL